jgi:putative membrane protein
MMWGYPYWTWGGAALMVLSMLVWFALLLVLIWAVVRWLLPHTHATLQSPLDVLRHRYARGEIDEATYARMRQHLTNTP